MQTSITLRQPFSNFLVLVLNLTLTLTLILMLISIVTQQLRRPRNSARACNVALYLRQTTRHTHICTALRCAALRCAAMQAANGTQTSNM